MSPPIVIPGVHAYALDVRTSRRTLATLRAMDHLDWVTDNNGAMEILLAKYDSVMKSLKRSRQMAKAISDSKGLFNFRIAAVDSVLVFGYEEMEDEPVYYAYRVLSGRRSQSFVLEMSRSDCNKP